MEKSEAILYFLMVTNLQSQTKMCYYSILPELPNLALSPEAHCFRLRFSILNSNYHLAVVCLPTPNKLQFPSVSVQT